MIYKKRASTALKKAINDTPGSQFVFMDIRVGEGTPQRVLFQLFYDLAPKTCENFKKLCIGNHINKDGEKLSYRYNYIHRVYKGAFVQGGDLKGISKS